MYEKKEKLINLNIIRGVATIFVFLYHGYYNMNCNYYVFNYFTKQATFWMTLFFCLSGFVLYYNYSEHKFDNAESIIDFLKKRAISIFPIYFLIWIVFFCRLFKSYPVVNDIVTFPFQLLLLQGFQHYNFLMNGGTWFFSCLFICYLLFPYICTIVKTLKLRNAIYLGIILYILNTIAPFLSDLYAINIYNNAFCRLFEFTIGICIARIYMENKKKDNVFLVIISIFVSIVGLYILEKYNILSIADKQTKLNGFSIICCVGLFYSFSNCRKKGMLRISNSKIVKFFSSYSLEFWSATFFTSAICNGYIWPSISNVKNSNLLRVIISFCINILIAILLKYYMKFIKYSLKKIKPRYVIIGVVTLFFILFSIKWYVLTSPNSIIDFETKEVQTNLLEGIYSDEGQYAWASGDFKVKLKNKGSADIFLLDCSADLSIIGEGAITSVYINDIFIDNIKLVNGRSEYRLKLPSKIVDKKILKIELKCSATFIPAEHNENSTDNRDLSVRLYKIGLE